MRNYINLFLVFIVFIVGCETDSGLLKTSDLLDKDAANSSKILLPSGPAANTLLPSGPAASILLPSGPAAGFTYPPRGFTYPPRGFSSPPEGLTAMTGQIVVPGNFAGQLANLPFSFKRFLLPPAFAMAFTPNFFKPYKIQVDGKDTVDGFEIRSLNINKDGSLSAHFYIYQIETAMSGKELTVVTKEDGKVLFKSIIPQLSDGLVHSQDLNVGTTALALLKSQKADLDILDILNSEQLNIVRDKVSLLLSKPEFEDLSNNDELQGQVANSSEKVALKEWIVTGVSFDVDDSEFESGKLIQLKQPLVTYKNGASNNLTNWATSDPQFAIIYSNGQVNPLKAGAIKIQVTSMGSPPQSATIEIKIDPEDISTSVEASASPTPIPSDSPTGSQVTTIAGQIQPLLKDGVGTEARFKNPRAIVADQKTQAMYIVDSDNHAIRKLLADGTVTTIAGNGDSGTTNGSLTSTRFNFPYDMVVNNDVFYVADPLTHVIRSFELEGTSIDFAGTSVENGFSNSSGDLKKSKFNEPSGVAAFEQFLYIADRLNHCIRKVDLQDERIFTFAGSCAENSSGFIDSTGGSARFTFPAKLAVDGEGNVYVSDTGNHSIRKVAPDGTVKTLAGNGVAGFKDANGKEAQFRNPQGLYFDIDHQMLFVADAGNQRIRAIKASGDVVTIAGTGTVGNINGNALESSFVSPFDLVEDPSTPSIYYIADAGNNLIRKLVYKPE